MSEIPPSKEPVRSDSDVRRYLSHELALFDIRTVFDPSSTATETLRSLLGAEQDHSGVAWIALPSTPHELLIEYVHGAATPLLERLVVPDGLGLTGKVFDRGAVDFVEHYATAQTITHDFDDVIAAERVVRMLAAPLRVNEHVAGVLTLASRIEGGFGDAAIERIDALARRVGLALEIARRTRLHAEAAAAAERARISEDLHDNLGALLFSINSRAERLRRRLTRHGEIDDDFAALQRDLDLAGHSMRDLVGGWHSSAVNDLHAELMTDAHAFEQRSGVRCSVVLLGDTSYLDRDRSEALLRFGREALLNVEKHAGATAVTVTVAALEWQTTIAVRDDGGGLVRDERTGPGRADARPADARRAGHGVHGFGLVAAAERIARLGGRISVVNDDENSGVLARAWIPR